MARGGGIRGLGKRKVLGGGLGVRYVEREAEWNRLEGESCNSLWCGEMVVHAAGFKEIEPGEALLIFAF